MRISEYPLASGIEGDDVLVIETSSGTKKVMASTVFGLVAYPVGSLYISYKSDSPAELFGGSWVQIKDVFLRAANDVNTGGSDTKSLTVTNMASHNHGGRINWLENPRSQNILGYAGKILGCLRSSSTNTQSGLCVDLRGTLAYQGSSTAFDIKPKYQDVYVWRRIA